LSARIFHIALCILFLSACKKEEFTIQNLNGNQIYVLGHGGMGYGNLYPINSMASLMGCINLGADGSEMDVQLTKDSVLVLFHDHDLTMSTSMSGTVQDLTWAELQSAFYTNVPYGNYPLVRLEDFISQYANFTNRHFAWDIKLYPGETPLDLYLKIFSEELVEMFNKYDLYASSRIESQSIEFLNLLKEKNTEFQLYYYPQTFEDGYAVALANGYKGISISTDYITAEQVEQAHASGIFVTIWGTSSKKKNEEAVRKNPDMIETDKVEDLIKLLQ
jgi:glycerophosphoryl diester phosphodiesterase